MVFTDNGSKDLNLKDEILRLKKVQRQQMGAYLCIASNNVPPAVSKRIILNVNCEYLGTVVSQSVWKVYSVFFYWYPENLEKM